MLAGYKELTRKNRVNAERYLNFKVTENELNAHAFGMVEEETVIEYDGRMYRIKDLQENTRGIKRIKTVEAEAKWIGDFIDAMQYGIITGSMSIHEAMVHALGPTIYTYNVIDSFYNQPIENFGNDNSLSLLNKIIETFNCEIEVDEISLIVTIRKKALRSLDAQFRYKHNLKAIQKKVNTKNLCTYIKGYGKKNQDGTYVVTAEWTSPNAAAFPADTADGLRHAPEFHDERFTDYDSLLNELKERLPDEPEITFTIDLIQLKDGGLEKGVKEGDEVFVIHEPLGIDIIVRVMEIEDYPETKKAPKFTLGNFRNNVADTISDTTKKLKDVLRPDGTVNSDMLDAAFQLAINALKSAQTELKFENGILAIEKTDPNQVVILNSKGLGISTDGGESVVAAITADGIVTELLTSGQINANNISVRGGDVGNYALIDLNGFFAKGTAFTVERPDGYKSVDDGILKHGFGLFPSFPTFQTAGVTTVGPDIITGTNNRYENIGMFTFKHENRYLEARVKLYADSGTTGNMSFDLDTSGGDGTSVVTLATVTRSGGSIDDGWYTDITMDLGVPDGSKKVLYVRQYGSVDAINVYGRILYLSKEG